MTPDERRLIEQELLPGTPLRMTELAESDTRKASCRGHIGSHWASSPDSKYLHVIAKARIEQQDPGEFHE